ncbi:MAG: hypothetical protein AAF205_03090 [Pseudomonadota bacterium]
MKTPSLFHQLSQLHERLSRGLDELSADFVTNDEERLHLAAVRALLAQEIERLLRAEEHRLMSREPD